MPIITNILLEVKYFQGTWFPGSPSLSRPSYTCSSTYSFYNKKECLGYFGFPVSNHHSEKWDKMGQQGILLSFILISIFTSLSYGAPPSNGRKYGCFGFLFSYSCETLIRNPTTATPTTSTPTTTKTEKETTLSTTARNNKQFLGKKVCYY